MGKQVVNRNNVVAGTFLIGSIVLAVAISFILSDLKDNIGSKTTYVFRFPTSVGVHGLESGAKVTFGGLEVGTVKSITAHTELDEGVGIQVTKAHDVVVALVSDLVLYEDAFADLTLPMLGGISKINIPSAGTGSYEGGPSDANVVLDKDEALRGRFAPSILTQLGFTTEEAEKIKATIDDVKQISTNVNESTQSVRRMTDALEPEFIAGVDDGKATITNIREFSDRFNGTGDDAGWSGRVDGILSDVQDASGKVSPTIDEAQATIEGVRSMVDENRPRVTRILDNAEQISEQVRFDSMGRINELLEKGSLALGSYKDVATDVREIISVNRPKIDSTLDSTRDLGVQAGLFVEELRAQPWRLMQKPSKDDLAREPIYEAARAYANAVSDLRIASQALDSAVDLAQNQGSTANAMEIARIAKVVDEAYSRYEAAEKGMLERLRTQLP